MAAQAEGFITILTCDTSGRWCPMEIGQSKIFEDGIEGARTGAIHHGQRFALEPATARQGRIRHRKGAASNRHLRHADVGFAALWNTIYGISTARPNLVQVAALADCGLTNCAISTEKPFP